MTVIVIVVMCGVIVLLSVDNKIVICALVKRYVANTMLCTAAAI